MFNFLFKLHVEYSNIMYTLKTQYDHSPYHSSRAMDNMPCRGVLNCYRVPSQPGMLEALPGYIVVQMKHLNIKIPTKLGMYFVFLIHSFLMLQVQAVCLHCLLQVIQQWLVHGFLVKHQNIAWRCWISYQKTLCL